MNIFIIGHDAEHFAEIKERAFDCMITMTPDSKNVISCRNIGYGLFNLIGISSENDYINAFNEYKENSARNELTPDDIPLFWLVPFAEECYPFFYNDIHFLRSYFTSLNWEDSDSSPSATLGSFQSFLFFNDIRIPSHFPLKEIKNFAMDSSIYSHEGESFVRLTNDAIFTPSAISSSIMSIAEKCNAGSDSFVYLCKPAINLIGSESEGVDIDSNFLRDLMVSELHYILSNGYSIKRCKVCGKYFAAINRSDTLYCDRTSPYDENKTCKEYGAIATYQKNLREDESRGLYRNIYMRLQMQAKRNPDIGTYKREFERFKSESKKWKADIKGGSATESQYIEWLKNQRKERNKREWPI